MAGISRRRWMAGGLGLGALSPMLARLALAQAPEPQVVKLTAQRFVYTPAQFRVQAGRPIVLEFTSVDFVHGFHMPDFDVRADLPPGMVTRVNLPAAKPGTYDFL